MYLHINFCFDIDQKSNTTKLDLHERILLFYFHMRFNQLTIENLRGDMVPLFARVTMFRRAANGDLPGVLPPSMSKMSQCFNNNLTFTSTSSSERIELKAGNLTCLFLINSNFKQLPHNLFMSGISDPRRRSSQNSMRQSIQPVTCSFYLEWLEFCCSFHWYSQSFMWK